MIEQFTLAALVLAGVWFVGSVYFQYAVRPFIHDCARFGVFAVRDQLRGAAMSGEVDPDSFAYKFLEDALNKMIHACSWFSFSVIAEYLFVSGPPQSSSAIDRFDAEAGIELKRMEWAALRQMSLCVIGNSLGWMFVGVGVYAFSRLRRYLQKLEFRSRGFWHDEQALTLYAK